MHRLNVAALNRPQQRRLFLSIDIVDTRPAVERRVHGLHVAARGGGMQRYAGALLRGGGRHGECRHQQGEEESRAHLNPAEDERTKSRL